MWKLKKLISYIAIKKDYNYPINRLWPLYSNNLNRSLYIKLNNKDNDKTKVQEYGISKKGNLLINNEEDYKEISIL